ncbi:hypothetical protein FRB95_008310 [Tulasnella sp. JGI-2019a]|nr:hypothetical protein FRB95_008310 [Tulasnella sp. JGI-2019a]
MAPPRKNIVRSGNAGNSSKSTKPAAAAAETGATGGTSGDKDNKQQAEKPPLFPHGSKTPLALLHEMCQKNGWAKPSVDTKRLKDGFTCIVHLRQKAADVPAVRIEPDPPLNMATADEAKHWGATYALFRFANNLQLHLRLPPGPREYWGKLSEGRKKLPEDQAWKYEVDPFAAAARRRHGMEETAAKRARREEKEKAEQAAGKAPATNASRQYNHAPEVKMASGLRDMVEAAITKYPNLGGLTKGTDGVGEARSCIEDPSLRAQLGTLGFANHRITKTLTFLATPSSSAYMVSLLQMPAPLDAALSHILLTTHESDLPKQFVSGGEGFVSSAYSGSGEGGDLPRRWMQERAVKEAGWPLKAVRDCIGAVKGANWAGLTEVLGRKLVGMEPILASSPLDDVDTTDRDVSRSEEREAILAVYPGSTFNDVTQTVSIPIGNPREGITLHLLYPPDHPYPSPLCPRPPPIYITSATVAPYVRLHFLSSVLSDLHGLTFDADSPNSLHSVLESGGQVAFACVEVVETLWQEMQDDIDGERHPDIAEVMKHLLPAPPRAVSPSQADRDTSGGRRQPKAKKHIVVDPRTDAQVLQDFQNSRKDEKKDGEMMAQRMKLPAWNSRDEIIQLIQKNRVVVVVGETGCGKTTQLPQFILDALITSGHGKRASILITQPRRVSALGVAARVSAERLQDGSVGYAIRGESKWDAKTKLLFMTTGVALRRLAMEEGRMLEGVSHVIVDEVHERSVDSDFLLLELRELLERNKTVRVVLMSATINQKTFTDYFGGAPVIEIPGFTHPVQDFYLENVIQSIGYRPKAAGKSGRKLNSERKKEFRQRYLDEGLGEDDVISLENVMRAERIDNQLIAAVVEYIIDKSEIPQGAILIFMPGVEDIRHTTDILKSSPKINREVEVLPLHANLTSDEQRRVFLPTVKRKVVVATNVAETSITIPEVVYVIDSGKVKEISYDVEAGLSKLTETWVSRAAARQRRGRAGRTQPGQCYKLYTLAQEEIMLDFSIPEILRVPLDALSLQVKAADEDVDVASFLGKAIDPPKDTAMTAAWKTLEDLGAVDEAGKLTALGKHMALVPLDLRLAKMLILAAIFKCLDPVLTVAASLSTKPLFYAPMDKRDEANRARRHFVTGNSDLLTAAKAYGDCMEIKRTGRSSQQQFCDENFIAPSTVREITSLRRDLHNALASIGFVPLHSSPEAPDLNVHSANENLVKAVICGGLWPRIAKVSTPKAVFDKVQSGTVERDHEAKEFKVFEDSERVFIHPQSIMFDTLDTVKSRFFAYFAKSMTTKVFLRDVTEVSLYGLMLFGGPISVDHIGGGLTLGGKNGWIRLKALPRIGVLMNQLSRLLDAQLAEALDKADMMDLGRNNDVINAMLALLSGDGVTN